MNAADLFSDIETLDVRGPAAVEIRGLACDSRKVTPGACFVAIAGSREDGAAYLSDALERGAAAVVSQSELFTGAGVLHVRVADARRALAELADRFHGRPSRELKLAGVTGTNGKTSVAYLLRDLLRAGGRNPGLIGTVAYEIGDHVLPASRTTPDAVELNELLRRMRRTGCDCAAMEVSSHAIDQQRAGALDFDVGVFTNLTRDHLDYHRDMESYFAAKARFFEGLKPEAVAVLNLDDPAGRRLAESGALPERRLFYGISSAGADLRATALRTGVEGSRFRVSTPWGEAEATLPIPGRFNVANALAALAAGGAMGLPFEGMLEALCVVSGAPGRMEPVAHRNDRRVFVDYAHTDDALRNVLSALREICVGRLIVVFGCGGDRDAGKRPLMGAAASELADVSVLTSDNPRSEEPEAIIEQILPGFSPEAHCLVEPDRRAAIASAIAMLEPGDLLLVAGKGHESCQERNGVIVPFDDREIVRELFR